MSGDIEVAEGHPRAPSRPLTRRRLLAAMAGAAGASALATGCARRVLAATTSAAPQIAAPAVRPRRVLILAPHPDDDLLYGAGVAATAHAQGASVKVVYMTNGDLAGPDVGLARQARAVAGQTHIGTSEDDLIFLGYPDGFLQSMVAGSPATNDAFKTRAGGTATYGNRGLGRIDFHTYRFGSPGAYNRATLAQDLQAVLDLYQPDDIYTTSGYDRHHDHATTDLMLRAALRERAAAGDTHAPKLHSTIVWSSDPLRWPAPMSPTEDHVAIPGLEHTPLTWSARESLQVPLAMQSSDVTTNPKYLAIAEHHPRLRGGLRPDDILARFVHRDEVFWVDSVGA